MKNLMKSFSVVMLCSIASAAHAEVSVIVNSSESASPSKSEVSSIFLGRNKSLKAVDQTNWTQTKSTFYTELTNKNETQLKGYWSGLVFTGKGQPLEQVGGDADVVKKVSDQPGTIGYVDSTAVTPNVKVLFTLP